MLRRTIGLALGAGLLAAALPSNAHTLNPPPTRVTGLSASSSGGVVEVTGTATFGGQRLVSVGTDPADDYALPMYDLIDAKIGQLDASTGDLTFVFALKDLPFNGSVPEAARYIWDFGIDMGGENPVVLSVEGKFTDVVRNQVTRTPAFQLRGNCASDPNTNVITCVKIADLTAEMIGSSNEIFVDVPKSILVEQAKGSIDGRPIVPADICEGISTKVAVYFSLCNDATTGDQLVQDPEVNTYSVAYKRVSVTAVPQGSTEGQTLEAALAPDGGFSANFDALAPGIYTIIAEACFGTNCGSRSVTVQL